jgi:predicted dinucleotide-binding enzyme
MRIAVLGTGTVGRALAGRLAELGHTVTIGTRDPDATRAREEDAVPGAGLATFAGAAVDADLVVNATSGAVALDVLTGIGADALAEIVIEDV